MLKHGNKIRLNREDEKNFYRTVTGRMVLPRTVQEHDDAQWQAIDERLDMETPEGRLLGAILKETMLSKDGE